MNSPAMPSGGIVIHEGYLFKTPPLDKFFMSWKKRWFVLSLLNPLDPSSLDLSYYCEADRKEKRGSINLHEIKAVNPVHNKSSKGNIFSVETEDRKFLLRSPDEQGKAVWVAKLLEGCSKEGTSFHVTLPNQPTAAYSEAILKVATPIKINVISSLNGTAVMSIPYDRIRRFGCQIALEKDILWFETCNCREEGENFHYMVVNAGIEKAYQVVLEYKRSIELALRDHMIMEEGNQAKFFYSFVVKSHYGHPEFSRAASDQIISNGLLSLSSSGGAMSLSDLNRLARSRPSIGIADMSGIVPGAVDGREKNTPSPYNIRRSPSPRLDSPTSPNPQGRVTKMGLEQVSRNSRNPGQYSSSANFDSGVKMEFDPSRSSAPCYLSNSLNTSSASWREQKQRKTTLDDMRMFSSLDEPTRFSVAPGRKTSLAHLQQYGMGSLPKRKDSRGTDSAIGSINKLNGASRSNGSGKGISLASYDHLLKKVDDMSVNKTSPCSERKRSTPAYIEA